MSVFIEDPGQVVAGVMSGDQLVQEDDHCPHGFKPNGACQCFINRRNAPTDIAGCKGREFHLHPAGEVVYGISTPQ